MELKLLLLYCIVSQTVSGEDLSHKEINDELDYIKTEIYLFTGQSVIKEELIVREILELKRSLFLLKSRLNSTSRISRDMDSQDPFNFDTTFNDSDIMERFNTLENNTEILKNCIYEKDEVISKLDEQIHQLKVNLNEEKERRLSLEKEVGQLWVALGRKKEL